MKILSLIKANYISSWLAAVATAMALGMILLPVSTTKAAVIVGGDLGGGDLLPANGDILSGTFTNVGIFQIDAGDTVFVDPGVPLSIQAAQINIHGTLDGSGVGSTGGAPVTNIPSCVPSGTLTGNAGSGPGGGGGGRFGCNVHGSGGGGGGYGGSGGGSDSFFSPTNPGPAAGGATFGDATSPSINLGSGGGSGSRYNQFNIVGASGAGGAGGSAISLFGTIDLDGTILADGADGALPTNQNGAGGGGGSGGGVLLDGTLLLNGPISATGGNGVTNTFALPSSGGGGGGGRIKLFGGALFDTGFSFDVSGGGVGQGVTQPSGVQATGGNPGTFFDDTAMLISIDIKPGSDPNGVNPTSKGLIPVAVLGSVDFDATQVDSSTVVFGPDEASPVHDGHVDDVNNDGFTDMVFHFKVKKTGIACGDTDATLTGETFDGTAIEGTDSVKTAGCK